jgi:hypothetical protein
MSVISSDSGQIEYVCWVAPVCSKNTAQSAYTLTPVSISLCQLWRAEFRIPPGHQGLTGIALWDSGAFIIPYSPSAPAWLVGDDDDLTYPYDKELGANVQLATYNTDDTYDHGWQVRLVYTPMSAIDAGGEPIVVPASADWLAGTSGNG